MTNRTRHSGSSLWLCFMVVVGTLPLVACAPMDIDSRAMNSESPSGDCTHDLGPAGNTRLAAVQQLIDDNKPYAAVAELDAMAVDSPKATMLRADALRQIGQGAEARSQYNKLLATCLSGRARHGLGLLAAREGQLAESLQYLKAARMALPTDPRVRNDFGYALLLSHRWSEAQFEFLTALDLQANDPRASRNLVLLAFAQGKPETAKQLADKLKIDGATLERLGNQAIAIRGKPQDDVPPPESAAPIPPLTASSVGPS